jgi:hypothetical protein
MEIIKQFFIWLATGILALTGTNFGGTVPKGTALFETSLSTAVTSTEQSMSIIRTTDLDGNSLSGEYGFIIDEGSSKAELVSCSASGGTLTSCKRGLSFADGTTTITANQKAHNRGAVIKMTDAPLILRLLQVANGDSCYYNNVCTNNNFFRATAQTAPSSTEYTTQGYNDLRYMRPGTATTVSAVLTFTSLPESSTGCSTANQFCNKTYVDSVAIAGGASSSASVYGISRLSVAPANANFPIAVGDNDTRIDNYIERYGGVSSNSTTITSVDNGDVLMVWGNWYQNNRGGSMLLIHNDGTTTTLGSTTFGSYGSGYGFSFGGYYLSATNTESVIIKLWDDVAGTITGGSSPKIMYQVIK